MNIRLWKGIDAKFLMRGAVLLGALLLYLVTLDNGLEPRELQGGDLITHQYAQACLRLTNAPGYPLYTMLGWAWFRMGKLLLSLLFNPIEILSLFSTLWGLGALLVLYLLLLEVTGGKWLISGLATAFYATTYFFWYYSVTTEEYTTGVLQTLLMVALAYLWDQKGEERYLLWLALLVGLALANLVTVLLALPALLWFILSKRLSLLRQGGLLARAALLALLPLFSYIYVYLQGGYHPEWRGVGNWPSTWAWFLHFLSTSQARSEMTWSLGLIPVEMPSLVVRELTLPVLIGGLLGIAFLGRRRGGLIYGTLLAYALFAYLDRFGTWFQVVMPAYPLIVLGLAVLAVRISASWPRWAKALIPLALLLLIANRLWVNFPWADQRDKVEDRGLAPGWAILADHPPQGATIGGTYEENLALGYLTSIWGERPDIKIKGAQELRKEWEEGKAPLFLTKEGAAVILPYLPGAHLSSNGLTLIQAGREAYRLRPPISNSLDIDFEGGLRLLGYDTFPEERGLHLALYWEGKGKMGADYSVSMRPTEGGELIFLEGQLLQEDHLHPVWGWYPTSRWEKGEVVRDDYLLLIPRQVRYDGLMVSVYRRLDGGFQALGEACIPLEGLE